MPSVADVLSAVHRAAPPGLAASWDASGLAVGDPQADVTGVVVALDLTPAVVAEAVDRGASLILTHHPPLFQPPKRLTADDPTGALVLALARHGIAAASAHTNLDAALGGVSFALADRLGLRDVQRLAPTGHADRKLIVTVPPEAADAVRRALAEAGAGRIGDYDGCSFSVGGEGRFRPLPGADPAIGDVGAHEVVREVRIEAIVPPWRLRAVRAALAEAHPYEEPAVDVVPLDGDNVGPEGYGALGRLDAPEALPAFLGRVRERLGADAIRFVGDDARPVQRVAVCGGSGMSFLPAALAARADAYVTADVTYHRFFEALGPDGAPRIALVDAGHYETEQVAEHLLADLVAEAFPDLPVRVTEARTSPVRSLGA